MKKKLLLIHKTQFGYHNNAYKHCQYLKDEYDITFVCFDWGKKRVSLEGVKVLYVPLLGKHQGLLFSCWRKVSFMLYSFFLLLFVNPSVTIVYYFNGVVWFKRLFPKKRMILDVRTLSVTDDPAYNAKEDNILYKTALRYDFVTFISEGIRNKIGFPKEKSAILPLGADIISDEPKSFSTLRLLYVGTLTRRKLDLTLQGVRLFVLKYPDIEISYNIVGDGNRSSDLESLKTLSTRLNLKNIVTFHGRIPNTKLAPFFDKCNIGVGFVPKTDYFEYQPVTKVFEYAMSGLYSIATSTYENKRIITNKNGILIEDTVESFANGLEYIHLNRNKIESYDILSMSTNGKRLSKINWFRYWKTYSA